MLITNAKIFTGQGEDDFASACQIVDGTFSWVGDAADTPDDGDVVDLGGAMVLPGLLDIHTHPALMGQLAGTTMVLPPQVTSMTDLIETLRTHPALGQGPDAWVRGFGFDDAKFPEGRWPNRHDLDQVSTTQPVFVQRCDGHSGACNTFLLERGGITKDTPDPPGASFGREADGSPDGRLIEPAAWQPLLATMPAVDADRRIQDLADLGVHFAERGLVGVADMAATFAPDYLASFRAAATRAWYPRLALYPFWADIKDNPPTLTDADKTGDVFVAGVKVLIDGAYSNATAWCHDPYPGTHEHGIRTTSPEDLRAASEWARANGVQLSAHAMGDAAIDWVIDEYAESEGWLGDVPSIRIEHATLFDAERIARVRDARMKFAVVSHTIFFYAEIDAYVKNLSPEQYAVCYPIKSFYDALPHTGLSSDNPATSWGDADNPFISISAAVTRRAWDGTDLGQSEAITVAQAVLLYTSRAATCLRLGQVGSVSPGYDANLVVVDRDIFTIEANQIAETRVLQTWSRGEKVFER